MDAASARRGEGKWERGIGFPIARWVRLGRRFAVVPGTAFFVFSQHFRFFVWGRGILYSALTHEPTLLSFSRTDAIFCCVGGGGLIAGVALVMKQLYPGVKVIGVEASDAAAMTLSLKEKRRIKLDNVWLPIAFSLFQWPRSA